MPASVMITEAGIRQWRADWKNLTLRAKTAASPPTSAVKVLEISSARQRP
jgi:hypothetical protein